MSRPDRVRGRLWLVRHGRTAWNAQRFLGRADVPLDEVGRAQAGAAGAALAAYRLDVVYTSPLGRARRTADAVVAAQRPGVAVRPCGELLELDCGRWEGMPKGAVRISRRDPGDPLPGGESVADAWLRVSRCATALRDELTAGRRVAVVGHYLTGQLLRAALLRVPLEGALHDPAYRPAPGSVHEVVVPA